MYTILTVDVEGHVGFNPVERLIYGKTKRGESCGIDLLIDTFDRYGMRGLFFVDIAEAWKYGEDKISKVLTHIESRGHDVGVHIHPDHMADATRLFLSEYSKKEQYDIIKKCTDFYVAVLGHKPKAFRAGKYGANRDTLDILAELGYQVDFSEFYGSKWCHINPPVAKVNVQKLGNGLIEIPVTSYKSFDAMGYSRYDKLDCEQCFSEYKSLINKLEKNNSDLAVLFVHSFSLIEWRRHPNEPKYKKEKHRRLEKQLEYVSKYIRLESISLDDTIRLFYSKKSRDIEEERIVTMKGVMPFFWFVRRAITVLKSRFDIRFRKL